MKPLNEIIGPPALTKDFTANERYYEKIERIFTRVKNCVIPANKGYIICEMIKDLEIRVVAVNKDLLYKIEGNFGRWGIFKGPIKYLELIFEFLNENIEGLTLMKNVVDIEYGIKTNANEIFYLPSKHWKFYSENDKFLILKGVEGKILKINKKNLHSLIRISDIKEKKYMISDLKKLKKEDFVLWFEDTHDIKDLGTKYYIEWAVKFVKESYKTNRSFPTIFKKITSSKWTKLSNKSGAEFLFSNAIHKNFVITNNKILDAQIDKRLFLGYTKIDVNKKVLFAVLNSVITYLGMELLGRTNLGEGVLDVNIIDYKKIPIIDPFWLEKILKKNGNFEKFEEVVDLLLEMRSNNIEGEATKEIRLTMEEFILGPLGFNKNGIRNLYSGLIKLVKLREQRARSIKK